ncbi:MAG: hypothetical protein IJC02_14305 [Lachnospiraceae bacterium]|nr:hypothetical protein [Lachnospiraceae bacterium]
MIKLTEEMIISKGKSFIKFNYSDHYEYCIEKNNGILYAIQYNKLTDCDYIISLDSIDQSNISLAKKHLS